MKKILLIICLSGLLLADNLDLNITDINVSEINTSIQTLDVNLSEVYVSIESELNASIQISDINNSKVNESNQTKVNESNQTLELQKIILQEDQAIHSKILPGCKVEKAKKITPLSTIYLENARKEVKGLSSNDLYSMINKKEQFFLIDIRDPKQYERGQIDYDNLHNIDRGHLEFEIEKVVKNKDDKIVLYCCTGRRSAISAKVLQDMGYTNVSHLENGLSTWVDERFPLLTQYGVMKLDVE